LQDAHEAWLHGWLMEMEGQGKLDHFKTEDIDAEPFLFRKQTQQGVADCHAGFKAGSEGGKSMPARVLRGVEDGQRCKSKQQD
jgi:hypothetical protein